jgi:hypothetical protein
MTTHNKNMLLMHWGFGTTLIAIASLIVALLHLTP